MSWSELGSSGWVWRVLEEDENKYFQEQHKSRGKPNDVRGGASTFPRWSELTFALVPGRHPLASACAAWSSSKAIAVD
jgi:hypothetical protein